jgi:hypothetical protein
VKYLILIYTNPEARKVWQSLSDDERAEGLNAYARLNEDLAASGELIATEALADAELTRQLRVRAGRATTTDGPFAEAKEQLAGFYLVDCETEERALEIAARIPEAEIGVIEVRPVLTYAGLEM